MPKKATEAMAMAIHKGTFASKLAAAAPTCTALVFVGIRVTALVTVENVIEVTLAKEAAQLVRAGLHTTTVVHRSGFTVMLHFEQVVAVVIVTGVTPVVGIGQLVQEHALVAHGNTQCVVPQVTTARQP